MKERKEKAAAAKPRSVIEQIGNHRSVRRFKETPVPEETLRMLVRCGQASASSSFIQAYSIVRVTDPEHRRRISAAAGDQAWIVDAPEFLVVCADLNRINYCCLKSGLGKLEGHTEHFIAATVDAALMAQNIMLAAESEGLGGVFIGGIRNAPDVVSTLLALPDLVYPVFGMCLGWPDHTPQQKPRMPVDTVLHQDRYHADVVPRDVDAYDALMAEYYRTRDENVRITDWSAQTARAVQGKKREHMLAFLRNRGFLAR